MKIPDYKWWVEHAHEDSAFLLLVDSPDLFEQAVLSRLNKIGRKVDQGIINQATYRAVFEQDRFGSMGSILEAIQPEPEVTQPRPFAGSLRTNRRALCDDNGSFPAAGITAFWVPWAILTDRDRFDNLVEYALKCGMTYVRWLGSHDWHGGINPSNTKHYFSLMGRTVESLARHGLRSQITLCTRRHLISDVKDFAQHWGDLAESYRDNICLVEGVNEWNHPHNGWTNNDARLLVDEFRSHTDVPLAISAPAAETWEEMKHHLTDLYTGCDVSATTVHFPRRQNTSEGEWRWVRQPWHGRWPISGCPEFVVDNEHQRWDKSLGGRKVSVAAGSLITAFVSGCAMSTHHDVFGVHVDQGEYGLDDASQRLQKVLSKVIPLLPPDVANWQSTRVGEGGGPHPFPSLLDQQWSTGGTDIGVSRSFAAVNGNDFVMVLSGLRDRVHLHDEEYEGTFTVISLETGNTICEDVDSCAIHDIDGEAFIVINR